MFHLYEFTVFRLHLSLETTPSIRIRFYESAIPEFLADPDLPIGDQREVQDSEGDERDLERYVDGKAQDGHWHSDRLPEFRVYRILERHQLPDSSPSGLAG